MALTKFAIGRPVPYAGSRSFESPYIADQLDGIAHFADDPLLPASDMECGSLRSS